MIRAEWARFHSHRAPESHTQAEAASAEKHVVDSRGCALRSNPSCVHAAVPHGQTSRTLGGALQQNNSLQYVNEKRGRKEGGCPEGTLPAARLF